MLQVCYSYLYSVACLFLIEKLRCRKEEICIFFFQWFCGLHGQSPTTRHCRKYLRFWQWIWWHHLWWHWSQSGRRWPLHGRPLRLSQRLHQCFVRRIYVERRAGVKPRTSRFPMCRDAHLVFGSPSKLVLFDRSQVDFCKSCLTLLTLSFCDYRLKFCRILCFIIFDCLPSLLHISNRI